MDLVNALQTRSHGENSLPDALNALVPALITRFNSEVAPRLLSRLPTETLPTEPRAASSFRSRVSLLVEYSIIEMMADFLREDAPGLNVTYNTTNEFADFFIRDEHWSVQLRLDIKTLHDLSAEASARYRELEAEIRPFDDFLLFVAWQWKQIDYEGIGVVVPAVLGAIFIPGIEIARERDLRQLLSGGSFDQAGRPLAASGLLDTNFGKMNRIVHADRRNSPDISLRIRGLLELMAVQAEARSTLPAELEVVEDLADEIDVVTESTDEV
jgi:hypothetical protein